MTRTRWTPAERAAVYEAAGAWVGDGVSGSEVIRHAMEASLPKSRWRTSQQSLSKEYRRYVKWRKAATRKAPEPTPAAPEPTPAPEPAGTTPEAAGTTAVTPAGPVFGEEGMLTQVSQAIVRCLLDVLYDPELRAAGKDLVREWLAPETPEAEAQSIVWRPPAPGRPYRPRVVIAGGLHELPQVLSDLRRRCDLRVWNGRHESPHRLKAVLKNADIAVAFTNIGSHAGMWAVKGWQKSTRGLALYWDRGAHELRPKLEELLAVVERQRQQEGT